MTFMLQSKLPGMCESMYLIGQRGTLQNDALLQQKFSLV